MSDMTHQQYADHRSAMGHSISRSYVSRLVREGRIPLNKNRRINPADADVALDGTTERIRVDTVPDDPSAPGDSASAELTKAKVDTEIYRARIAELNYLRQVGELVPIEDVTRSMQACAETIVRAIDRLPAAADDLSTAHSRGGAKQVRAALKILARDLRQPVADNMRLLAAEDDDDEAEDA